MKYFIALALCALFLNSSLLLAGEQKVPQPTATQKTTVFSDPVQKASEPVQKGITPAATQKGVVPMNSPVQKITPMNSPVQKTTPMNSPVQKSTPYNSPVQKGTAYSANALVEVPGDLLAELQRLAPQPCQPLRNLGRAAVRNGIKRRIANYIQDNN